MSIRRRMTLSFAALLALFGVNLAIYLWGSNQREASFSRLEQALDRLEKIEEVEGLVEAERQNARLMATAYLDPAAEPLAAADISTLRSRLEQIEPRVVELVERLEGERRLALERLPGLLQQLLASWLDFYNSLGRSQSAVVAEMEGEEVADTPSAAPLSVLPPQPPDRKTAEVLRILAQVIAEETQQVDLAKDEFSATDQRAFRLTLMFFLITAGVALTVAWLLSSYLSGRLKRLKLGAHRIGSGELAYRIPVEGQDELAELATAFNEMSSRLLLAHSKVEQARRSAERANRAKSTFLASMSHELRTPMNAIIGYSEMLIEDAEEAGDPATRQDLERILAASRHLLGLINDVLDLSKVEAGKMTLDLDRFDLQQLLQEVTDTTRPLVEKNGNQFELAGVAGIGEVTNDATKLRQTLLNLLGNAAKFTTAGRVILRADRYAAATGERLRLAVIDTGIGMTEEQVGRIFEQFTQAEADTASKYGGTGLGLAISREFCRLMGGDIEVASKPGVGTTFTVDLPAVVEDNALARLS